MRCATRRSSRRPARSSVGGDNHGLSVWLVATVRWSSSSAIRSSSASRRRRRRRAGGGYRRARRAAPRPRCRQGCPRGESCPKCGAANEPGDKYLRPVRRLAGEEGVVRRRLLACSSPWDWLCCCWRRPCPPARPTPARSRVKWSTRAPGATPARGPERGTDRLLRGRARRAWHGHGRGRRLLCLRRPARRRASRSCPGHVPGVTYGSDEIDLTKDKPPPR